MTFYRGDSHASSQRLERQEQETKKTRKKEVQAAEKALGTKGKKVRASAKNGCMSPSVTASGPDRFRGRASLAARTPYLDLHDDFTYKEDTFLFSLL